MLILLKLADAGLSRKCYIVDNNNIESDGVEIILPSVNNWMGSVEAKCALADRNELTLFSLI